MYKRAIFWFAFWWGVYWIYLFWLQQLCIKELIIIIIVLPFHDNYYNCRQTIASLILCHCTSRTTKTRKFDSIATKMSSRRKLQKEYTIGDYLPIWILGHIHSFGQQATMKKRDKTYSKSDFYSQFQVL